LTIVTELAGVTPLKAGWLRALAVVPLVALAAACTTVEPASVPTAAAVAEPSAPQPVAGYDWHLTTDDGWAQLAYGIAESDELKLGLACGAGSGRVEVTSNAPSGTRQILLESGGETERLSAQGEPSQLSEGDLLTAETAASAPVFLRFRRIGWMAQWIGDRRETYVPQPGSEADVERFFALCD